MNHQIEESKRAQQASSQPNVYIDEETNMAVVAKKGSTFSLGRMASYCKNGKYAERIGAGTPIYMSAVLEYLVFEILELAAAEAGKDKKLRITPTHIMNAIQNDPELRKLVNGQFCNAGYAPRIKSLAPRNGKKAKKVVDSDDE